MGNISVRDRAAESLGDIGYGASQGAITAFATGGQANATPVSGELAVISVCATAGDSVKLPVALAGRRVAVANSAALGADVFPYSGDTINSSAANLAVRLPPNSIAYFECFAVGAWRAFVPRADASYSRDTTVGAATAAAGALSGAAHVVAEYSAVGAAALTMRTAAQMIADSALQVGESYMLTIVNTSAGTTTLTTATGITLTGTMTLATNTTRTFVVTVTAAGAIEVRSVSIGTIA